MDRRTTSSATCSVTRRYELHVTSATSVDIDSPKKDTSSSALKVSFEPKVDSAALSGGGGEPDNLRQGVSVTCLRPFSSRPGIGLTMRSSRNADALATATEVCPPVIMALFLKGPTMDAHNFQQNWRSLSSTENIAQIVLRGAETKPIDCRDSPKSSFHPASVRRALIDTLGMHEVEWNNEGAADGVELIAAEGELLLSTVIGEGVVEKEPTLCLVGVQLHGATGAARLTFKTKEHLVAKCMLNKILELVRSFGG